MGEKDSSSQLVAGGILVAFVLLIAAVWASDASASTSLAITGVLVLAGLGVLVFSLQSVAPAEPDRSDEQRRRMDETTP